MKRILFRLRFVYDDDPRPLQLLAKILRRPIWHQMGYLTEGEGD